MKEFNQVELDAIWADVAYAEKVCKDLETQRNAINEKLETATDNWQDKKDQYVLTCLEMGATLLEMDHHKRKRDVSILRSIFSSKPVLANYLVVRFFIWDDDFKRLTKQKQIEICDIHQDDLYQKLYSTWWYHESPEVGEDSRDGLIRFLFNQGILRDQKLIVYENKLIDLTKLNL